MPNKKAVVRTSGQQGDAVARSRGQDGQAWAPGDAAHFGAQVPGAHASPAAHLPHPHVAIVRARCQPLPTCIYCQTSDLQNQMFSLSSTVRSGTVLACTSIPEQLRLQLQLAPCYLIVGAPGAPDCQALSAMHAVSEHTTRHSGIYR